MVRLLAVTNWYPPHHFGGYELSAFDVMTRLEARGHEVHVLCGDTTVGGRAAPHPAHESRVRRELRLYHDGERILRPSWRDRLAIERHNQAALRRALVEVRPDVVSVWHLAGVSQGLLTTLARAAVPVVFSICDDWLTYGLRLDAWGSAFARSRPRRALGRLVEAVTRVPTLVPDVGDLGPFLFVTRATEARALATARWHPRRRAVVWSGIDRNVFDRPADPARPWRWRLVATGRFDPRKGYETVIRALALLPGEAVLECWGRGGEAERARLAAIAAEVGVEGRVRFGTLEREELPDRYRAADVMVFPSVWPEPFGLVPIEAMACGTPVVATGVGGSAEFLDDGVNCLLFPAEDHEALAERIRRLAEDAELRARVVESGLRTAEELDVERLADVMEAWHVHEATGRHGPDPSPRPQPGAGLRP
ncbi:MAG: glycosyltransferase [Acidimicrobiia bacterium]